MPSASSVGSFALVVALVTMTPGLDTALVLRTRRSTERWIEALTGGALLGFGVKLAGTSVP